MENNNLPKFLGLGIIAFALIVGSIGIFITLKSKESSSPEPSVSESEPELLEEESDEPEEIPALSPDEEDCEKILAYRFASSDSSMDEKVLKCEEELFTLSEDDWNSEDSLEEYEDGENEYSDSDFENLFNEFDTEEE